MAKFKTIWNNYPDKDEMKKKCFNKQPNSQKPFSDYCAILLSECLIRSGFNLSSARGNRCWSHSGPKHLLLAEDVANWLAKSPPVGIGKRESVTPNLFQNKLSTRTGIIFFKDYWQRGNESFQARSGDHIDLWNKNEITSSGMFVRNILEFFGRVSDLNKSRDIWFWEIK